MSGSGKMQYDTNDGKKKEDEPMIDPHNLDYFLEQDTNPSLFQEKEDLEDVYLSLEESLSVSRWLLDDIMRKKLFWQTFILFFLIPLFCLLPWYANTDEIQMKSENLIASCKPDDDTGEVSNPIW